MARDKKCKVSGDNRCVRAKYVTKAKASKTARVSDVNISKK